jgi:hypothetical protein
MRIQDVLYWAPGIPFAQVDFIKGDIPALIQARIEKVYLEPANLCSSHGQAFAAGVLLVAATDAFAKIAIGGKSKRRAAEVLKTLPSFAEDGLAERFVDEFRNGLVHEARIKKGGQFCLDVGPTVFIDGEILLVNPIGLAAEVEGAVQAFLKELKNDEKRQKEIGSFLNSDYAVDLAFSRQGLTRRKYR